jgi:nucleotide-binding universal stress UspA family protein
MYKHILISIDGSINSVEAAKSAILLAQIVGAKVTCICIMPRLTNHFFFEANLPDTVFDEYSGEIAKGARRNLDTLKDYASEIRVLCSIGFYFDCTPHRVVTMVAEREYCDLIVVAMQKESGIRGLLFGSEAKRIIDLSRIPVLILPF